MISDPTGSNRWTVRRVVRFAQTESDQALLQAVEAALESQFHGSFSALCKQALRSFLLPQKGQVISPVVMQEQILELQERLAQVERRLDFQTPAVGVPHEPVAEAEIDPLLIRLGPLLEDF